MPMNFPVVRFFTRGFCTSPENRIRTIIPAVKPPRLSTVTLYALPMEAKTTGDTCPKLFGNRKSFFLVEGYRRVVQVRKQRVGARRLNQGPADLLIVFDVLRAVGNGDVIPEIDLLALVVQGVVLHGRNKGVQEIAPALQVPGAAVYHPAGDGQRAGSDGGGHDREPPYT